MLKEMWDYLAATAVTADFTSATFDVNPQRLMVEDGMKNQVVHLADDDSEEVISFGDDSTFFVTLEWPVSSATDTGTIFDFYHDSSKANGWARSFYWSSPDGHTYTVKFRSALPRGRASGLIYSVDRIQLKIVGRAP